MYLVVIAIGVLSVPGTLNVAIVFNHIKVSNDQSVSSVQIPFIALWGVQ